MGATPMRRSLRLSRKASAHQAVKNLHQQTYNSRKSRNLELKELAKSASVQKDKDAMQDHKKMIKVPPSSACGPKERLEEINREISVNSCDSHATNHQSTPIKAFECFDNDGPLEVIPDDVTPWLLEVNEVLSSPRMG